MANKAKCLDCNIEIESISHHDFVSCKCKNIFVDGGPVYWRCGFKDASKFLRLFDDGTAKTLAEIWKECADKEEQEIQERIKRNLGEGI